MLIQCPECQFSRTLDESKVPSTAQIATCPRCKARFRFRNLDKQDATPAPGAQYQETGQDAEQAFFDKNQTDKQQPADNHEAGSKQETPRHQKENKPRDIWDHIASLGEKWDQHKAGQRGFQEEPEPAARTGVVPWEHPERFGFVGGFFKTIMRVLMRGKLFFSSMPPNSRLSKPLIFYFLVIALHFLISFFWIYLFSQNPEVAASLEQFNANMEQVSFLQLAVFIPFNAALTLIMLGFTFSLLFRLSGIKNVSLMRNIRILCYASSGLVLVIIPILGPIMSSLFVVFSSFQGFAYSYNIPPARAALLVLPVYLLLFLIVLGTSMSAL